MRLSAKLENLALDYLEKYKSLTLNGIGNALVIGALFSIAFVFIFPDQAITTLMHDVFQLPGPGAGVALLLGPFAILAGLFAYSFNPRPGTILFSVVAFGFVNPIGQQLFNQEGLGMFPFYLPLASFIILAIFLDVFTYLFKSRDNFQRMAPPAVISNILFLVFWWVTIFPLYLKRWPVKNTIEVTGFTQFVEYISPILIIIGLSLVGAVLIGSIVPIVVLTIKGKRTKDSSSF